MSNFRHDSACMRNIVIYVIILLQTYSLMCYKRREENGLLEVWDFNYYFVKRQVIEV